MRPPTVTRSFWSINPNVINATLYDKLNFNFIRDIAPVASIDLVPIVMEINPSVPAKTVPEFIAYAKANPGKINMASGGNGTSQHVSGELFKMMTGVDMHARALSRRGPALNDLLAGQVQIMFGTVSAVDRAHQGRQAARAGGDHRDALGGAAGHSDRGRLPARLRGEQLSWRWRAEGARPPRSSTDSTRRSTRRWPNSQIQARLDDLGASGASRARPPTSASFIAAETVKWGKVIRVGRHQAGLRPTSQHSIIPFREPKTQMTPRGEARNAQAVLSCGPSSP